MSYEIQQLSFKNKVIVCTKKTAFINEGDLVYCYKDDESGLRVSLRESFSGIYDVNLHPSLKPNFSIVGVR